MASEAIRSTEEQLACKAGSLGTDNTANMLKMRNNLADDRERDIVSYGCSANYINLLAKDVVSGMKYNIVQVIKYFRIGHLPAAWYRWWENAGAALGFSLEHTFRLSDIVLGLLVHPPQIVEGPQG